ncbi:hypothetical protein BDZ85DRAFT_39225 [Elsinoe ampelina]|uniref:Uncharacterized protein n=1 Tax=Elsinoe ampelina TaxID=302913 RepID=A0A6A6G1Q1_9PEZI|nr:hypothetical protein BDZ85DRAFT_39225 [Elsinoe ampelina]
MSISSSASSPSIASSLCLCAIDTLCSHQDLEEQKMTFTGSIQSIDLRNRISFRHDISWRGPRKPNHCFPAPALLQTQ